MSRNWSEKQSSTLIGKWYTLKSMGYELFFIDAFETENSISLDYKLEKEDKIESIEVVAPKGSLIPSIAQVFLQGTWMQQEIQKLFNIEFDESETEMSSEAGYSYIEWGLFHPLLPEPMKLKILMKDEVIEKTCIETGYNFRGIEDSCVDKKVEDVLELLERTTTMNSFPLGLSLLHAIEEINRIEVPEKAKWVRMILNEMSSLNANLYGLNYSAQCLGLLADSTLVLKLISYYQEAVALISEHPFLFGLVKVGGLNQDISRDKLYAINAILQEMEKELISIKKKWVNTPAIEKRLKSTGKIDGNIALVMGGRPTRAAGDLRDSREYSKLPYSQLTYTIPVYDGNDCFARTILKLDDSLLSLNLINQAIENLPKGDIEGPGIIDGSGQALIRESEANGEVVVLVKQEQGRISSIKIRNASALHFPFLPSCLKGIELTDLPLILSSFDLDLAGMEK